jgi:hypothetical protein
MAALNTRTTRKKGLNSYFTETNFGIEQYIQELKDEIEQAKEESRPTNVKKEIIIMCYAHGVDLPDDKINRSDARVKYLTAGPNKKEVKIRQCVAGSTGTLMSQQGIFKDKLIKELYKNDIHKLALKQRKTIIENTIRLNSAEYTHIHSFGVTGPARKRYYNRIRTLKLHGDIFNDNVFEKMMNYGIKTIKPQYNHAYDLEEPFDEHPTVNGKNDDRFGFFTVLYSTEPEDSKNTVFGCCASSNGIDISKINKEDIDLYESDYWKSRLKKVGFNDLFVNLPNQASFRKHNFHRRVIFLSTLLTYLSPIYENIYIIDISCRDLERHVRLSGKPKEHINRNQMNLNEMSKGSYSPLM